jgi:hypothetical protein
MHNSKDMPGNILLCSGVEDETPDEGLEWNRFSENTVV